MCAAARLLMQMAAMPPYAGLDEVYHVARLAFVRAERRNPTITEPSVPPYLVRSIAADPSASPAFCVVGPRWPQVVRGRGVVVDRPLYATDLRPYVSANYEAQQPSLYYSIVAPLVPMRTPMFELRAWRLISALFALMIAIGTAWIGERWFGAAGILAGALVVSLPTWLTLVVRASNDAFACAVVTIGIAVTASAPRRLIAEPIAWALAVAAKLYMWPILIVLPFFWRAQHARLVRVIAVVSACAFAAGLTMADLSARTRNPFGDFGFDVPQQSVSPRAIRALDMLKITVASAVWTSGQHWDAMSPVGMALYVFPIVVAGLLGCWVARQRFKPATEQPSNPATVAGIALLAFAFAQVINAAAFIRQARAVGIALPFGGKEGWYWYALVPIVVPALLAPAVARFRPLAWWIIAWDVLITEVALFHDFSGASSAAHPTILFRWGPWHLPFTAHLTGIGVGPLVDALILLRIVHLAAFFALESLSHTHDRSNHLALPSS